MSKAGICEALSACCCCVTHEELNVMPKGRVRAFDKVGCLPPPTWVLSGTERTGPALESHIAAASQPLLLLPTVFRRGQRDSASSFLMALRDSKISTYHKKDRKRFVQEGNCKISILFKINLLPCTMTYLFRDYFHSHGFPLLLH